MVVYVIYWRSALRGAGKEARQSRRKNGTKLWFWLDSNLSLTSRGAMENDVNHSTDLTLRQRGWLCWLLPIINTPQETCICQSITGCGVTHGRHSSKDRPRTILQRRGRLRAISSQRLAIRSNWSLSASAEKGSGRGTTVTAAHMKQWCTVYGFMCVVKSQTFSWT